MPMTDKPLERAEIAKILRRHEGAKAEVARRAKVKNNTVSMWLAGSPSTNVAEQAEIYANELLAKEESEAARVEPPPVRAVIEEIRSGK